jgi:hypothetical protein
MIKWKREQQSQTFGRVPCFTIRSKFDELLAKISRQGADVTLDRKKSFIKKNNELTEKGNVLETICQLATLGTFLFPMKRSSLRHVGIKMLRTMFGNK